MAQFQAHNTPEDAATKAAVLIESLPWLKRFRDEVIVVKFGGNAMVDPDLTRTFAEDMVFLHHAGLKPVVVHGGGPQISAALEEAGIESEFRGGLRVTSADAMVVVREVLATQVGAGLVQAIDQHGEALGVGISGDERGLLTGVRRGTVVDGIEVDLGHVGDVSRVDPGPIRAELDAGRIPVISTVAREHDDAARPGGGLLNVNADSAAAAIAVALGAAKLVVLTDVPGLYANWPDRDSILSVITADELRALIPSLQSGMIPKMTACLQAVDGGVPKSAIIDGRAAHSILLEVFTTQGVGTEVVP